MPYMIAANAVPIIAFAPITNAWFGILSPWSKIAIAGVLCFFPVLVNTLRGLTSVRPESIELMRSYAAAEREIFRRVRIPTSLPFVFTALKVASVLAMIGAVIGDYFGGSTEALGVVILSRWPCPATRWLGRDPDGKYPRDHVLRHDLDRRALCSELASLREAEVVLVSSTRVGRPAATREEGT